MAEEPTLPPKPKKRKSAPAPVPSDGAVLITGICGRLGKRLARVLHRERPVIGVGIVLALIYWVMISVFAAFGASGVLDPMLAAWAPNLVFGAAAAYLLLTVRT